MNRVLVTGATGNTGREVLRALNEREIPCNAAARSVAKVTDTFGTAVEAVEFDFVNPATWRKALKECSGVFLLRPPAISKVKSTLNPFIDIAHEEGVKYIIFLSVAGADTNRFIPHHQVEQHLISRSAPYTILRPGFFAQNFQDAYRQDIREANRICVPAGSGKMAFIDLFDVAEVAAEAFCNSQQHARKAYTLSSSCPETPIKVKLLQITPEIN